MSADDVIMRMMGTGSHFHARDLAHSVTLLLFWLLDESPRHYIHAGSLTREGGAQMSAWRRHEKATAEGDRHE